MNEKLYKDIEKFVPYDEKEAEEKDTMLKFIKDNDDVLTRNNKIAHFTTSAWIFNKDKTKVLMIHHNIYNSWAWIGGHADGDDDLRHVVLKEIEEETGLTNVKFLSDDIYSLHIVTVDNHMKRGKYVGSHLHMDVEFVLEADEEDSVRIKEDENSGVKWINIEDIEKVVAEEKMIPIYKLLTEKVKNI